MEPPVTLLPFVKIFFLMNWVAGGSFQNYNGLHQALIVIHWITIFGTVLKLQYIRGGRPYENVEELKQAIIRSWRRVQDIEEIRAAIAQFLPRLQAVVDNNGGAIKHIFG